MEKSQNPIYKDYIQLEGSIPVSPIGKLLGPYDSGEEITVTIILRSKLRPPKDQDIVRSGPNRISRKNFLSKGGAFPEDIEQIISFAARSGLTVIEASAMKRSVKLGGSVGKISAAFGVKLEQYEINEKHYRIQSTPINIPKHLGSIIEGIFGLDNRPVAKPRSRRFDPNICGVPNSAAFNPPQVAAAYGFPLGVTGAGQTIAILELGGGYTNSDMSTYFNQLNVPLPSITAVSVDGGKNQPDGNQSSADLEVCLDIQICGSVAPGAKIVAFFAPNSDQGFLDALTSAIHDISRPSIVSISWGNAEKQYTPQFMSSWNSICQDAAWLGVTVLAASGDFGSSDGENDNLSHADFPASSPFVLGCGGTTVTITNGVITGEVVWNNACGSSGGGISDVFNLPAYQNGVAIPVSANPNGRIGRGVPDVAGNADPATGYLIRSDGVNMVVGGTSAVSPLWAAYVALINEWTGDNLGLFNFRLYNNYSQNLRDVVAGNNGAYNANMGWDPCTGFGSPSGMGLLSAIECTTVQHRIKPMKTECGLFAVQGGTVTLIEELITVPFRATVTYKWNVTAGAAQILGADNHYSVVLTVPPNTQNISVSVSVWIDGCNFTDTFTFTPLDPAIAMRIERFCRLRRYIHVNMFINALWDPLRDLVTRPLTNNEIQGMTNIVEGISQLLEDTQH